MQSQHHPFSFMKRSRDLLLEDVPSRNQILFDNPQIEDGNHPSAHDVRRYNIDSH